MKREMSVAGSFYPAREVELERYFEHFNTVYSESSALSNLNTRAVIVPHAGYIYSGYTANMAYRVLQHSNVKNLLVIGPSHRVAFHGVSICDTTSYETPFGGIDNADDLSKKLKDNFSLIYIKDAHYEHSTEVQFPFIKYYMSEVKIVELVYSKVDAENISKIIDFALKQEDCGVIISTDLSHFYEQEQAKRLDSICLESLKSLDIDKLRSGCEACGMIGVEAIMLSAKNLSLNSYLLDYRTSADASGDTSRVVGYMSACFI